MDNSILLQLLNDQSEQLKKISQRLDSIEKALKKNTPSVQPEVQQQVQGSSALAHLNSLGVNW
jgi:hypothetical protein